MSLAAASAEGALAHNLPWLYAGRALRSFGTAFLTVVFPLYLAKAGYGAAEVGLVLSLSGLVSMALVTAVGIAADRVGRRSLILVLSLFTAAGGALLALAPLGLVVAVAASGLGGIGRGGGAGSGGAWGPVFPAEQPLLTASVGPRERTRVFGVVSFVGVIAGAAGSLVAVLPPYLLAHGVSLLAGYRLLFAFSGLLGLAMTLVTLPVREPARSEGAGPKADAAAEAPPMPVRQLLGRLGLTNALNGFGIGFLGPLLTYWFYRRFGVGSAEIGVLYALINLASAAPYLGSAWLAQRFGAVRTVVSTRLLGTGLLVLMPFMPSFVLVGAVYALRMVLNSLGLPARQSFTMNVSDDRHRGRIAAFGQLPSQITSMISPAIAGAVMGEWLDFPLFGAALFIALNAVTYHVMFHNVEVPGEERAGAAQGHLGEERTAPT